MTHRTQVQPLTFLPLESDWWLSLLETSGWPKRLSLKETKSSSSTGKGIRIGQQGTLVEPAGLLMVISKEEVGKVTACEMEECTWLICLPLLLSYLMLQNFWSPPLGK